MPRPVIHLLAFVVFILIIAAPFRRMILSDVHQRNFRAVEPGRFYRSGQMTPSGLRRTLEEYGIKTVISFRESKAGDAEDDSEILVCRELGVDFHRFPPLNWSMPDASVPAQINVDRFVRIINDKGTRWPMLVHCFAGVHRTGAFTAIYRIEHNGWNNDDAIREMLEVGRNKGGFETDVLAYLRQYPPRTPRGTMPSLK